MTSFPQNAATCVKVYGSLAAAAKTQRHDSALRLWHLARMIDDGSGVVSHIALNDVIGRYISGSERHLRRLFSEAEALGWLAPIRRHNGEHVVVIRGLERVARSLNESKITQAVFIPATELRRLKTWRAACWDAFLAGRSGRRSRPISRRVLARVSGVDERSQRRYERSSARVTSRRNIAITAMPSMFVEYAREHGERAAFPVGDHVGWQLPNSYEVRADLAPRGMARRISKALAGGLLHQVATDSISKRVFFELNRAERVMRRADRPAECYGRHKKPARSGAGVWRYMCGNAAI